MDTKRYPFFVYYFIVRIYIMVFFSFIFGVIYISLVLFIAYKAISYSYKILVDDKFFDF